MKKLAIITTHPIQYNAPFFRILAIRNKIKIKVFYTWGYGGLIKKYDPGFGKVIDWDIPLLDGYDYEMIENVSKVPGSHHFNGIDNPNLIESIVEWGADALLVYGWSFKSHLKVMRYFHGKKPVFFRGDSTVMQSKGLIKNILRQIFLKWVYKNVDKAFYVGTNNRKYYERCGLTDSQLSFAPHAIDNARFDNGLVEIRNRSEDWRSSLGINEDATVFLYAGKLDANKNVETLVDAFLMAKRKNSFLIVAGNGATEITLKSKANNRADVIFLPFQNQLAMPALYGMADIFVLPSFAETWGLSINEAMVCGKAIVASNSCGAAIDLVIEAENGYTFDAGNVNQLKTIIEGFTADRSLVISMGNCSRKIIKEWNFEHFANSVEDTMLS